MANPQYGQSYGNAQYNYPPGYVGPYAQQQQYQPTPPQIRNPFAAPAQGSGPNANYDPEYEAQIAQWQSAYLPQDRQDKDKKKTETSAHSAAATTSQAPGEKRQTVVRKGGGQVWEDPTLLDWDPTHFRIRVGNLAGEVTDDSLAKAFAQYGVSKARVIRDKRTTKSQGYGFVSFSDGELGFKAAREMTGKYIGSHPVTIERSKTDLRPVVKKDNKFNNSNNKNKKNKNKNKQDKPSDPLRANTGAHVEKKTSGKTSNGIKMLG